MINEQGMNINFLRGTPCILRVLRVIYSYTEQHEDLQISKIK